MLMDCDKTVLRILQLNLSGKADDGSSVVPTMCVRGCRLVGTCRQVVVSSRK